MCCHSEHTYLYTQATLNLLSTYPNGAHMRRLSQELEKHVQDRYVSLFLLFSFVLSIFLLLNWCFTVLILFFFSSGPIARKMSFMMTNITKYPELLSSLSSILTANAANPADVAKVSCMFLKLNITTTVNSKRKRERGERGKRKRKCVWERVNKIVD